MPFCPRSWTWRAARGPGRRLGSASSRPRPRAMRRRLRGLPRLSRGAAILTLHVFAIAVSVEQPERFHRFFDGPPVRLSRLRIEQRLVYLVPRDAFVVLSQAKPKHHDYAVK